MLMIDREMPTCCENCFAQQEYYNPRFDETEYSCGITYKKLGTHSRQDWGEWHCDRPEWCPVRELIRCDDCIHHDSIVCKHEIKHRRRESNWYCADALKRT